MLDGAEVAYEVTGIDDNVVSWLRGDGCRYKELADGYAPIPEWNNCPPPDDGKQTFKRMRALRKGQAEIFALQGGIVGEARIVERAFGLGPCALTEAMAWLQDRPANAET